MRFFLPLLTAGLVVLTHNASATIITLADYPLGEAGTIAAGFPQDVSGNNRHFVAGTGTITTSNTNPGAPGSTDYAVFDTADGNDGSWNANFSSIPTDNFAVELWARTPDINQVSELITTANATGAVKIHVNAGNWAASINGLAWIGGNGGAGQPATPNSWTHLGVVRENGSSTFYINGIAQGPSVAQAPVHNAGGHIGVQPGGAQWYNGDLDAYRIFSFDPNTDDPVAAFNLIPEPSSFALLILGLCLIGRMRRQ